MVNHPVKCLSVNLGVGKTVPAGAVLKPVAFEVERFLFDEEPAFSLLSPELTAVVGVVGVRGASVAAGSPCVSERIFLSLLSGSESPIGVDPYVYT